MSRVVLAVLGLSERNSYVDVGEQVHVRMGWAFRAMVPRSSVLSIGEGHDRVLGWGAHGWRGAWLINGSSSGLVRIEFDPHGGARCIGLAVSLRVLRVSVVDPGGLEQALTPIDRIP